MKRILVVVLTIIFLALSLAGCGLLKQYTIGARATVYGQTVQVNAELWEYINSGLFAPTIHWAIDWGDGTSSDEKDAIPLRGSNWASTEPLHFLQWTHVYAQTGDYDIMIKATNADALDLMVHIK